MMDAIAGPFGATRHAPWQPVVAFLEKHAGAGGGRVLDLAGGNGRHALEAARQGFAPVLLDVSGGLVRLARDAAQKDGWQMGALEGDALHLPFKSERFDLCLFIAGVHCIRGRAARVQALVEMRRVLRPGAEALVSVWAAEQDRFRETVLRQKEGLSGGETREGEEVGDVLVPWSREVDEPVMRFFHVYDEAGLCAELEDAGLIIERVDAVTLTRSSRPDNLFATVRAPTA
jgi:tRNA (uracil-5-)-methyltransferase TRM9